MQEEKYPLSSISPQLSSVCKCNLAGLS
jgi:hypothetical protein